MSKPLVKVWDRITVFCMNHDVPEKMMVVKNSEKVTTPFYGCMNYRPDAIAAGLKPCPNRLNLDDYQGICMKVIEVISNGDPFTNYTNYKFTYRGTRQKIEVTILLYTDTEIRLGIMNRTVLV